MFSKTQKINVSPIKQMELLASKIPDVVSLAQGIPSFDTPKVIKKAVLRALDRGAAAKYSLTYGMPEFREAIEQKLSEDGMYFDFEKEIIAVAGSIEGITSSLISIIEPDKNEIVIFSPDYTSYAEAIKVAGGIPVYSNLIEENGWQMDMADLENKIGPKTAAVLFSNPNNPTGVVFSRNNLLKIAELAGRHRAFILSDEAYRDFIYAEDGGNDGYFSLAQIPELRKRVIRIFSFSKSYAMSGWRVGFVHSDEENIREIVKVHDSLVTCAPVISQFAAMAALDFAGEEIAKFRDEYRSRRELICARLDGLDGYFSYRKPRGAYFVFPKINREKLEGKLKNKNSGRGDSFSWKFALDLLDEAHVAVVPGAAFGPAGEDHVRLSFGRKTEDINEAMDRIKKYLKG